MGGYLGNGHSRSRRHVLPVRLDALMALKHKGSWVKDIGDLNRARANTGGLNAPGPAPKVGEGFHLYSGADATRAEILAHCRKHGHQTRLGCVSAETKVLSLALVVYIEIKGTGAER
jgi:hypothetical protein